MHSNIAVQRYFFFLKLMADYLTKINGFDIFLQRYNVVAFCKAIGIDDEFLFPSFTFWGTVTKNVMNKAKFFIN